MAKKKAEGDAAKGGKGKTLAMAAVMVIGVLGGLKGFVLAGSPKAAASGVTSES